MPFLEKRFAQGEIDTDCFDRPRGSSEIGRFYLVRRLARLHLSWTRARYVNFPA